MLILLIVFVVVYELGNSEERIQGSRKKWGFFKKIGKGLKSATGIVRKAADVGGNLLKNVGEGAVKKGLGAVSGVAKEAFDTIKDPLKKAKEYYDIGKQTVVSGARAANALAHGDLKKAAYETENAIEPLARKVGDTVTDGAVSKFEERTGMKAGHYIENISMLKNPKNLVDAGKALMDAGLGKKKKKMPMAISKIPPVPRFQSRSRPSAPRKTPFTFQSSARHPSSSLRVRRPVRKAGFAQPAVMRPRPFVVA